MIFPTDLSVALATMLALSILAGWLGNLSKRFVPEIIGLLMALAAVSVLVAYAVWLQDNLLLTRVFPVANVMAWGNLQTPAMGLLAGIAWSQLRGPPWQRRLLVGALVCMGLWRMASPFIGQRPALKEAHWRNGICVQSTGSTCSPAAAATLLRADGIRTTEAEMTDLCLTHTDGTSMLGLYRGLKLKTHGTAWKVAVFAGSAADLRHQPLPAVVTIHATGVPTGVLGAGNRHAVVVFRFFDADHLQVGEPFTGGRQWWTVKQFQQVYDGSAIALVRRGGQ